VTVNVKVMQNIIHLDGSVTLWNKFSELVCGQVRRSVELGHDVINYEGVVRVIIRRRVKVGLNVHVLFFAIFDCESRCGVLILLKLDIDSNSVVHWSRNRGGSPGRAILLLLFVGLFVYHVENAMEDTLA